MCAFGEFEREIISQRIKETNGLTETQEEAGVTIL